MSHYSGISPPYFEILIYTEVDWKKIHDDVMRTIEKYFGKLEACGYGRLPVRYILRGKTWDDVTDDDLWY
jgi:hypothetical protein